MDGDILFQNITVNIWLDLLKNGGDTAAIFTYWSSHLQGVEWKVFLQIQMSHIPTKLGESMNLHILLQN